MKRLVAAALAALLLPALAQAGADWTGKVVLLKGNKEVKIGFSDDKGTQVFVGKLDGISYRVLADKGGFLRVNQNGAEGWFSKSEAIVLDEAIAYFTARLKSNPNDAQAYGYRAEAALLKEDYVAALRDLGEAIRLKPGEAIWYSNRAYVRSLTKDYDNALKDCDVAQQLNGKLARVYLVRGNIWRARKDADKAIAAYSEALKLEPKSVSVLYGRANALWDRKLWPDAARDYEDLLKLQPDHVDAMNELAFLLAATPDDKVRNGKRALELAVILNKTSAEKNADHLDTWAAALAEIGDFDQAVMRIKQALAVVPLVPEARQSYEARLKLYQDKKKYREE